MKSAPRYGEPPVIDVADMGFDPSPVIRQRDRMVDVLSHLSPDEWDVASRCAGWSVQDVAEHLAGVNEFWLLSISAGLRDEPTRLLQTFDPVAGPAEMVNRARGAPPAATLERLAATNERLAALLRAVAGSDLDKIAEAPPGHLSISGVCAHALWDAWIHERDMLLPLGHDQKIESDEVAMTLAYVTALGPACYLNAREPHRGSLAVYAKKPSLEFSVQVSHEVQVRPGAIIEPTATIAGNAVDLVEGLSCRGPQPKVVDDHRWLVDGVCKIFAGG